MSEMSPGAKAAWERWQEDDTEQNGKLYGSQVFMQRQAFAAGFEAALAVMERQVICLREHAQLAGLLADRKSSQLFADELAKVKSEIQDGLECDSPLHLRCQEANKR